MPKRTSVQEPVWLRKLMRTMVLKNFKEKTQRTYVYALKRYVKHTGKDPMTSTLEDILNYQEDIIRKNEVSFSTYRINCCALRFFYNTVHPQDWSVEKIPFPKKELRLVTVLSEREVIKVIICIDHPMVRAMIQLIYATGMRLNEARTLKVMQVDGQRERIRILRGKGGVDREIPLTETVRKLLKKVYRSRKNQTSEFLFASPRSNGPIEETLFRKKLKQAVQNSGVAKNITAHTFRHSFATHHLEQGMNIRQLQKLLGHKSINTTLKYIHLIEERWNTFQCLLEKIFKTWKEMCKTTGEGVKV